MSLIARLLVITVVITWGFNFVVIRWGMEGIDPFTMTTLRFLLTSLPLVFFIKKPNIKLSIVALHGTLFGAGLWGLVNIAVSIGTPAGLASLLLQASAFFTLLAAVYLFEESLSFNKKVGLTVAFSGFLIILFYRQISLPLFGGFLILVAAVFWTLCNIIIRKYKPENAVSFIVWSSLFVPIPVLLISLVQSYFTKGVIDIESIISFPTTNGWLSILFQSYVITLFGYGVWTWAITKHGLSNVAPYSLLVPVSGLLSGWFFYNETLSTTSLIGVALIMLGLCLLSFPNLKGFSLRGLTRKLHNKAR
ncbi:MAG: EamA family transporter [Psychromonas sp.]